MAALRLDQARTGAAGAIVGTPEARTAVNERWFTVRASTRIDRTEFGVTAYRGVAGRYLDMTMEVRCVRT
jgi:polyisoprenoid-binding protein YceI